MDTAIAGTCQADFDAVRSAFERNFEAGDIGASCAVTVGGELVVDLWGGHSDLDRHTPWERDTIVNVWSTTKMTAALCVLMLHDRGQLSVDEPMATYWPEFAANGKEGVLVRHAMGHTAGLPAFDEFVDDQVVFDWDECCRRLAAQPPRWAPGNGSGYHAETQGWLLGELVRRVDGRTIGDFFREEVAEPLGVDFHIGLADEHFARVADLAVLDAVPFSPGDDADSVAADRRSLRSLLVANTSAWRRAQMPASGGHGNARSVALAMAPLANGGSAAGSQLVSPETIERIFEVQADGVDRVLGRHFKLGIGYGLNSPGAPVVANERSLWWAGWGGSMCVVDLENNMTVAYVMNRMMGEDDFRAINVIFAAHAAVAG